MSEDEGGAEDEAMASLTIVHLASRDVQRVRESTLAADDDRLRGLTTNQSINQPTEKYPHDALAQHESE